MGGVLVHVPGAKGDVTASMELGPGEAARFGRGAPGRPVELVLDDPSVPRLAGEIRVCDDHWQLSNFSELHSFVVENPEGAGEYFRVAPRRVGAPVPFEFARILLPSRTGPLSLLVYAPDHVYCDTPPHPSMPGGATLMAFPLDETSNYFLVLVALCEPRLRDMCTFALPTTRQVAERLRDHPDHEDITEAGINFHINYLARHKLRVRHQDNDGVRMDGRREAVVSLALRFGLVRENHLSLLPSRTPSRMRTP